MPWTQPKETSRADKLKETLRAMVDAYFKEEARKLENLRALQEALIKQKERKAK